MKKLGSILIVLALVLIIFTSCSENKQLSYPLTVGGSIVEQQPQKVVSLSPIVTNTIISLNERDLLVGVNNYSQSSLMADDLAKCGTPQQPDIGAIISLEADVVITVGEVSDADANELYGADITTVSLTTPKTLVELEMFYTDIASVIYGQSGGLYEGGVLYNNFTEKISYLYSQLPEGSSSSYLYIINTVGNVVTGEALESSVFSLAGLTNSAGEFTNFVVTEEDVADLNPDFILCDQSITLDELANSIFSEIPAVANGDIVYVDTENFELYSTAMYYDIYHALQYLHPETFKSSGKTQDIAQLTYYAEHYLYSQPEVEEATE